MKEAKIFRNIKSPSWKFLSLRFRFDLLLTFVSCFIKERKFNCRWFTLSLHSSVIMRQLCSHHEESLITSWRWKMLNETTTARNWMRCPFLFTKQNFRSFSSNFPPITLWGIVQLANLWLNFYWVIVKCFSFSLFVNDGFYRSRERQ